MSGDINKLIQRLRATFFEETVFSLHDVRDAANALEALVAECDFVRSSMWSAVAERDRLKAALVRLRDCDWVIRLPDRMDAVREIAREALEAKQAEPAPAVCEWTDHGPEWISTCKHRFGAFASTKGRFFCPGCGGAIKFTEAKE